MPGSSPRGGVDGVAVADVVRVAVVLGVAPHVVLSALLVLGDALDPARSGGRGVAATDLAALRVMVEAVARRIDELAEAGDR